VRITDFGVAKVYQKENSSETSGTPGYMAPEVMCAQNHSYVVDYFAVGVIAFEFMYGVRPYLGKSRKEIKDLILSKQVQIKPGDIYDGWSLEAADFINKVFIY
jgi:serine/threonine protein kinase